MTLPPPGASRSAESPAINATLVDLNGAAPYADFREVAVGPESFIYPAFTFNPLLADVDVFMSISKMKTHYVAGVTHTMKNLQPGVLVAGRNPVATDAVATAVMGLDPAGEYRDPPSLRGDNHLNIAAALGVGTNRLAEIEVVGVPIDAVRIPFAPAW